MEYKVCPDSLSHSNTRLVYFRTEGVWLSRNDDIVMIYGVECRGRIKNTLLWKKKWWRLKADFGDTHNNGYFLHTSLLEKKLTSNAATEVSFFKHGGSIKEQMHWNATSRKYMEKKGCCNRDSYRGQISLQIWYPISLMLQLYTCTYI